jgi:cytochrome P450
MWQGLWPRRLPYRSLISMPSDAQAFDLYSAQIDADPFPHYQRLREEFPCYWSDRNGIWILSRYEDVLTAAQDWQTYSSAQGNMIDEIPGRAGATLGTTDPPRHERLRNLARSAFAKRNLQHLEAPARSIARAALADITAKGACDFVADFASRVTVGVLFRLMGLPEREPAQIRRKVILSISTDKRLRGRNEEQIGAFRELGAFIAEQVEARRADPRDDLIGALATAEIDGDRLSEREVVLTSTTFVMAGVESLSSFMSMLALNLHDYPGQRRRLLGDMALLGPAIEESLRFNTSAQRFMRVATRVVELHGQCIRPGDRVALAYGAANRDWRKFPDPDVYDIGRHPIGHLGFGSGPHFCLGNALARLVTAAAMDEFLRAVPEFHLVSDRVSWIPSSNFRSPAALLFQLKTTSRMRHSSA